MVCDAYPVIGRDLLLQALLLSEGGTAAPAAPVALRKCRLVVMEK